MTYRISILLKMLALRYRNGLVVCGLWSVVLWSCGLVVLWSSSLPAQFGQRIITNPPVNTDRALIGLQYSNIGSNPSAVNLFFAPDIPIRKSLGYPHLIYGNGFYGTITSPFHNFYNASMGEAVWTLTSDGQVALTGLRPTPWIRQYIRPVPYDPKGRPEETWGVVNPIRGLWKGGGPLPALATYWPGISKTDEGSIYARTSPETTPPVQIANYRLHAYIQDVNLPEEILITQWTNTKQGITTQARVHDWSNPDFDDFVLVEYVFTNTGDFDGDGREDQPGQTRTQERAHWGSPVEMLGVDVDRER